MPFLIVVIAATGVDDDPIPPRHEDQKRTKNRIEEDCSAPDRQHIADPSLHGENIRSRNHQEKRRSEDRRAEYTAKQNGSGRHLTL